uniref:RHS repeat domain-containing protein n=1 Tax=Paenibacillus sonchi TaxID=373687 RepID=UPI0005852CB5
MSKRCFTFLVCFLSILLFSSLALADKNESIYFYNAAGQLIEVSNSSGTIMSQYDSNGNLIHKYRTNNLLANSNFEAYSGLNGIADGWNAFASPEAIGQYEVVSNPVSEGSR